MMATEAELRAAIAADPSDPDLRHVFADFLLARGDERGELLSLDLAEREGRELANAEPLLRLAAIHGFPRWPGDPDDALIRATREPHSFRLHPDEHVMHEVSYRGFLLDILTYRREPPHGWAVHAERQLELDLRDSLRLTDHHVDVILSIISRAIRQQRDLATLTYPTRRSFEDLERFTRKRPAYYHVEIGVEAPGRPLRPDPLFGVIDYERWDELWRTGRRH